MLQWHRKIEASEDQSQLIAVARDFLASFEPEDLATVPSQGRPTQIKGIDDLAYWHQRLVDCYCTGAAKGEGWEQVRSLLNFFSFAIQKAAELDGQPPIDEHEAAARLFSERSVPKLFTSAMAGPTER